MTILNPTPPRQLAMPAGGTDTRYYDMVDDLQPLGDSVATIVSIAVARADGNAVGVGDLTIAATPEPWIGASPSSATALNMCVNWWQSGNLAVATDYIITVTVTTAQGRTIPYACRQLLSPTVG